MTIADLTDAESLIHTGVTNLVVDETVQELKTFDSDNRCCNIGALFPPHRSTIDTLVKSTLPLWSWVCGM
jgi:hypothetical protein